MPKKLPRCSTPYFTPLTAPKLSLTPKTSSRAERCWAMVLGITTILNACEDAAISLTRRQESLLEVSPLLATLKTEIYGHDTPVYLENNSDAARALHDKFMQLERKLARLRESGGSQRQQQGYPCLQCSNPTDGTSEFCSCDCANVFYRA